ncbi:MAG: ABC transporter ATP-binding protein, partial [Terriglobia bacterium]
RAPGDLSLRTTTKMPVIAAVRNLRKSYGKVQGAGGISFEVRSGEIFGLLGPNGAGKTTTVECLLGLCDPDSGDIELFGMDARRHPAEVRQKIGAALQTTSLQDKITPREALRMFGSFYRHRCEPRQLLERFALTDKSDAPFDTLSGGQRQRLALALAFVNDPELVVLDEPSTGLDPQARRDLHHEIAGMDRDRHAVLLTTHNIEEAERLCDRIAIIDRGRIVATGTPRELINRSTSAPSVFLSTVPSVDPQLLATLPAMQDLTSDGSRLRFTTLDVNRTLTELLRLLDTRGIQIAELSVRKSTLEDVLLELTGGNKTGEDVP